MLADIRDLDKGSAEDQPEQTDADHGTCCIERKERDRQFHFKDMGKQKHCGKTAEDAEYAGEIIPAAEIAPHFAVCTPDKQECEAANCTDDQRNEKLIGRKSCTAECENEI